MQIRYCGPSAEGVTLADGSLTFLPGEAVEVADDLGASLIAQGTFQAVKAVKATKTEEVTA